MSDSVRSHRRQPTRLRSPWDSPGKNTGVGCHFLLQCMKVKSESEVAQSCLTVSNPMDCSLPGSSVHGIFQARVLELGAIAFSDRSIVFCYSRLNGVRQLLWTESAPTQNTFHQTSTKANAVLPKERTGHSKHPLPTTQEKTLHMDITRWSTPKWDWLYSLQPKIEKLYTVSKN